MLYDRALNHVTTHIDAPKIRDDIRCAYKYIVSTIEEYETKIAELKYNRTELEKDYLRLHGNVRELENLPRQR